ncbi:hypothetical protein [Halovenus marina]|uniref:hypothetical protein n=1 Tax=Halovenus marina TaxID=3396621 RepID=UPI003F572F47
MSAETARRGSAKGPGVVRPGIRCGLEMLLVGALVVLVGLPAENAMYRGAVFGLALVSMVVVLFWALDRQMRAWLAILRAETDQSEID